MNKELFNILIIPTITGLFLVVVHSFFGQIILRRGIVFLDLAMAQFASLGYLLYKYIIDIKQSTFMTHIPSQMVSIVSVLIPTILLVILTDKDTKKFLEGIIAMLYAFAFSTSVLIVEGIPGGFEAIKEAFLGSLVTITSQDLQHLLLLYTPILLINIFLAKKYIAGNTTFILDGIFYFSLGIVVTSSVKLVGVFTVFTLLVIPPLISLLIFSKFLHSLIFSYLVGFASIIISVVSINISTTPLITFVLCSFFFLTFVIKKLIKK